MTAVTQCPVCGTCFKVNQDQLDARQGWVRCGNCQAVFNAGEHARDDQPSPQLELNIAQQEYEATQKLPALTASEPALEPQEAAEAASEDAPPDAEIADTSPAADETAVALKQAEEPTPLTLAQQITIADGIFQHRPVLPRKKRNWPWVIGSLLLLMVMLAQVAYFLRIELAANLPGLKPALVSYCKLLNCSVPLPRKIDLISIESSDLEADPAHANFITLHAILRNNAPYAQTYPDIELSFTDLQDKLLARRTFKPGEYLKSDENEMQGIVPRRETSIKLHLDTSDIKPSGYRLFLYYPPQQARQ